MAACSHSFDSKVAYVLAITQGRNPRSMRDDILDISDPRIVCF